MKGRSLSVSGCSLKINNSPFTHTTCVHLDLLALKLKMKHHGADASVELHAYCTLDML